jgi:hypothetical protein
MTTTKSPVFAKAIPSILLLAGNINKATFAAAEVVAALKQYKNGDVVSVLDTLSMLTDGKFAPARNKSGTVGMREAIAAIVTPAKTRFKQHGYALALLDITEQDATEEVAASFVELATIYSAELKATYEASKPVKAPASALTPAPMADADTTDSAETGTDSTAQDITIDVDTAVDATVQAIRAGMLTLEQVEMLRIALAVSEEVFPLVMTQTHQEQAVH